MLTDFYLDESARGKGIGKGALTAVLVFARSQGLKQVDLFVIDGNERAERLYGAGGFDRVSGRFAMSKSLIENT